jgi:putative membrane protein
MTKNIPWKGVFLLLIFSVILVGGLLFIIYEKETQAGLAKSNFSLFIFLNTALNSASVLCILTGKWAINRRKIMLHKKMMMSAFVFSSLFLVSYIYYHYNHGNTLFLGQGLIRPVYFFILISHLVLAAITLPAVLITFYFAFSSRFSLHKSIAIYTIYAWLYVSITGVLIYFLLQIFS